MRYPTCQKCGGGKIINVFAVLGLGTYSTLLTVVVLGTPGFVAQDVTIFWEAGAALPVGFPAGGGDLAVRWHADQLLTL
jgi:hypothetical protein